MVLEFLADGFEEIEALTPVDVLRRAGIEVKTVSVGCGRSRTVTGAHGIAVEADITSDDAEALSQDAIEMIILPGGMPGAQNLDEDETVDRFISYAAERGLPIAAICAAPMILGRRGLLQGRRAVCYPGFEDYLEGAVLSKDGVAVDGNFITARGMGVALDFSLELVRFMKGDAAAEKIKASVLAK